MVVDILAKRRKKKWWKKVGRILPIAIGAVGVVSGVVPPTLLPAVAGFRRKGRFKERPEIASLPIGQQAGIVSDVMKLMTARYANKERRKALKYMIMTNILGRVSRGEPIDLKGVIGDVAKQLPEMEAKGEIPEKIPDETMADIESRLPAEAREAISKVIPEGKVKERIPIWAYGLGGGVVLLLLVSILKR